MHRKTSGWFGQIIQRSDDGGKTWIQPGTPAGRTNRPGGMPKGESNKFVYDTFRGKRETAHHSSFYDGKQHPWNSSASGTLNRRSPMRTRSMLEWRTPLIPLNDGGKNWKELSGLRGHGTGPRWQPGAGGMCLHTIILDKSESQPNLHCHLGRRRISH